MPHQKYYDWRPSHTQELLLKAALLPQEEALQAWKDWKKQTDLDHIDYGSHRLLPLLYSHLKSAVGKDPNFAYFRKIYLETWADNQKLFARVTPALEALHQAGIRTLVLKGVDLILHYYQDFGARPMSDFDLLVPKADIKRAIDVLQSEGWSFVMDDPEKHLPDTLRYFHAVELIHPNGGSLDLHWHTLVRSLREDADQAFWNDAIPLTVNQIETLSLSPSDALFHICIHGLHWNMLPPIRWVADAMQILESDHPLDWARVTQQAKTHQQSLLLGDVLSYLRETYEAPVPESVLRALDELPKSRQETREYKVLTHKPLLSTYIHTHWIFYPRIAEDLGLDKGLFAFLRYYLALNALENVWQIPRLTFNKVFHRIFPKS
jgi:hypothetical protein